MYKQIVTVYLPDIIVHFYNQLVDMSFNKIDYSTNRDYLKLLIFCDKNERSIKSDSKEREEDFR
jgi:hypothetical protein